MFFVSSSYTLFHTQVPLDKLQRNEFYFKIKLNCVIWKMLQQRNQQWTEGWNYYEKLHLQTNTDRQQNIASTSSRRDERKTIKYAHKYLRFFRKYKIIQQKALLKQHGTKPSIIKISFSLDRNGKWKVMKKPNNKRETEKKFLKIANIYIRIYFNPIFHFRDLWLLCIYFYPPSLRNRQSWMFI